MLRHDLVQSPVGLGIGSVEQDRGESVTNGPSSFQIQKVPGRRCNVCENAVEPSHVQLFWPLSLWARGGKVDQGTDGVIMHDSTLAEA